jgi:predicted secreted protein
LANRAVHALGTMHRMEARRITLRVGEAHELRLHGMASAGYHWSCEVEGGSEVVEVAKRWGDLPPGSVGTSAEEIFTVSARRPGRARLRFDQRRPWEGDEPPVETLEAIVEVEA